MAHIDPVSDLRNHNFVLEKTDPGAAVLLSCGGSGRYKFRDTVKDDESGKKKAMFHFMYELKEGRNSGDEEGYVSADEVRAHFHGKCR